MEREKDIEKRLKCQVKRLGGLCFKFTSPGTRGVPDRLVIFEGRLYLVELKRPDGEPSPVQKAVHRMIEARKVKVWVVKDDETLKTFIDAICTT